MRTQEEKNVIPTSLKLDLSTIDKKINKLVKYLKNCSIDLKDDGKKFVNFQQSYETIIQSLDKRKYKESLSILIYNIYLKRFEDTKTKLKAQGLMTDSDMMFPMPLDDFGSKFDAFAATNTDPNNTILQFLNVTPYKDLKVEIFEEQEIKTYLDLVSSAVYDYGNISFLLTKLDSLADSYINIDIRASYQIDINHYIKEVKEKIFYVKYPSSGSNDATNSGIKEITYSLVEKIPKLKNAEELMELFLSSSNSQTELYPPYSYVYLEDSSVFRSQPFNAAVQDSKNALGEEFFNVLKNGTSIIEQDKPPKSYDYKIIEQARIKLLDLIIRKEIMTALQQKINALDNLNDFKSKYLYYNFLEEKLISTYESKNVKKENLFFKITYSRETKKEILENKKQSISPLNVEFISKQNLKFETPYNSLDTNKEFVAIINGTDISKQPDSFDFFNPTILCILSDLEYIDSNIYEVDPFYCPTPQSLQADTKIEREKYQNDKVVADSIPIFSKDKNFVDSNIKSFNFINFPNLYFLPNIYPDAISFYESTKEGLSKTKAEKIILDNSKYYYQSSADTPSSNILRDANSNELFKNALLNNGFYGPYEARKNSFANPDSLQGIINKLTGAVGQQYQSFSTHIQDVIFARTNISCLLKEFQTCFLPNTSNCRDILRGFRFSELEDIVKKVFPESAYAEFYEALMQFKINNIKDERERRLLEDLKRLENAIKNNERKRITFIELDKRTEPGKALDIADRAVSNSDSSDSLQQQYEKKLQEYKNLKEGQYSKQLSALDKAAARKSMDLDELEFVDRFLDFMEKYGINVDILCSILDLANITPMMFGFLQLPKFPTIDLFQEVKLSLDLTIVQIIYDSIVAFILKILSELLTCGGIKNLIGASLTGEADGSITGAAAAALSQLNRGKFDLDDFVNKNPQIDPVAYNRSFANIAKTLKPPITLSEESGMSINADLGILGNVNLSAKSKTQQILNIAKSSTESEVEIKNSLTGLISYISKYLPPQLFIKIILGNGSKQDRKPVEDAIRDRFPELNYLLVGNTLEKVFNYLAKETGLDSVVKELYAMSSFYSSTSIDRQNIVCLDPSTPVTNVDKPNTPETPQQPTDALSPDDTYRNLIQDLLTCSPEQLRGTLDDKVFKPLLIGKLPNGKTISAVEKATSEIVDVNFKTISEKFKDSCNSLYSNLVVKKPFKRKVPKTLKQSDGNQEYENAEYKDLVNKGGYPADGAPDPIEIEEQKFVYGALFTDNFYKSSTTLSINSEPEKLLVSLTGATGYTNIVDSKHKTKTHNDSCWKILNTISENENTIAFYVGNIHKQETLKFNFKIHNKNIDTDLIYQESLNTKQEFKNILKNNIIDEIKFDTTSTSQRSAQTRQFDEKFGQYTNDSYDKLLSLIYGKITKTISEDGLLKQINLDSLEKEKYITGIKDGLDSVIPFLSKAIQDNSIPPMVNPNIDTPLKYINFCPKPTKQQKDLKIDPGLFGKSELKQFISEIMENRKTDIVDRKTLEQMIQDNDNYLKFSIIDGLYLSLIRTACTEVCMRALFPLRVFEYNKKIVDDLMLPTYVAEMLYDEIMYKSVSLKKDTLMDYTEKDINYIHDFIFSTELDKSENDKLFKEIKKLKKEVISLEEDKSIMSSYLGKLYNLNIQESGITLVEKSEEEKEYEKKIQYFISCLTSEINDKNRKILLLQLRNIAYNEFQVIFDKLSYITSTNKKVKEQLDEKCKDTEQDLKEKDFLSNLIPELLIKSELTQITTETRKKDNFIDYQEKKYVDGPNLIIEHYIDVPPIKNIRDDLNIFNLMLKQRDLRCYGPTSFGQFEKLLQEFPQNNTPLSSYFDGELKYGMRVVFIPDTNIQEQSSIIFDESKSITENFDLLINNGKNIFLIDNKVFQFKDSPVNTNILYPSGKVNRHEKTYAIPFVGPKYLDENKQTKRKFGVINAFPIIKETQDLKSAGIVTVSDMIDLIPTLQKGNSNKLTDSLKTKISCNQEMKKFYSIFTNENLLSNLTILSSIGILSGDPIVSPFRSIRKEIINNIYYKLTSIYNNDDLADILEKMSTIEYFKDFNAWQIPKASLKAAVYVLMYYCQMTDPNISFALILRNAVKLSLSMASQIPNPFGGPTVPSELPLALSPLALYSMAQLPITVFGVPPVGIGVGPPITIPGLILLGADALLLGLEFSESLDLKLEDDKIKEELRKFCFDLSGYKKYGV